MQMDQTNPSVSFKQYNFAQEIQNIYNTFSV